MEENGMGNEAVHRMLSNPIRKKIIVSLMNDKLSFSHLMKITQCETGKLSFHLSKMKEYLQQDELKRYGIKKAVKTVLSQYLQGEKLPERRFADSLEKVRKWLRKEEVTSTLNNMLPHFLLIVGLSIFSIAVFSKVPHSEALLYDPGVQRMIFAGNGLEREIDNLGGINRLANNSSGASAIIGLVFIMFGIASTKSHLSSTITRSLFLSSILIVLLCITAFISLTYSSQFLTNKDATKQISD